MAKVVIIGAGSGFGGRLSIDILSREILSGSTISLCDIDAKKLAAVTRYLRRVVETHKLPAKIESTTDRRQALAGADFVVTSVSVGGPAYYGHPYDVEVNIPNKYGVYQSVADTLGAGGVFRFLRSGPVQLEFCRDIESLCPHALMLNYTNPMAMLTWAHSAGSKVKNVGLCHSVQNTTKKLAGFINMPYEEISYQVAGINHQAWILELRQHGEDLYPRLREAMHKQEIYDEDRVRFEMMRYFGYFVTESSNHNSEYLPYFRRTQELREKYGLRNKKEVGVSSEAARIKHIRKKREWLDDPEGVPVPELVQSNEYASGIMEAVITDRPFRFNGNVINTGLVTNLPRGCCVEVPCMVDGGGVHPCHVGDLPAQCAALNRTNINVQELAVKAVLECDKEAAFHAVAVDPLTASLLPLDKIRAMFNEMWEGEKHLLTYFNDSN